MPELEHWDFRKKQRMARNTTPDWDEPDWDEPDDGPVTWRDTGMILFFAAIIVGFWFLVIATIFGWWVF